MRVSIRLRTIIALNAFVIGLAVVLGWIAQDAAGQVVEERFVTEMVNSASAFLRGKTFPRSDAMMRSLRSCSTRSGWPPTAWTRTSWAAAWASR